jgi:hypothetical protein
MHKSAQKHPLESQKALNQWFNALLINSTYRGFATNKRLHMLPSPARARPDAAGQQEMAFELPLDRPSQHFVIRHHLSEKHLIA